jgi:hypothetical protein
VDVGGGAGEGGDEEEVVRDEIIVPYCYEPGYFPAVNIVPASDVSMGRGYNGGPIMILTQPANDIVSVRWQGTAVSKDEWDAWACFNIVPNPDRVTSWNRGGGEPAVFASSTDGRLSSRFSFGSAWGPWLPLTPPSGRGRIEDLEAVAAHGDRGRLYAARAGKLFVRYSESSDSYSALGPWRDVGHFSFETLAVCRIGTNRDRVFVTTRDRELWSAIVDAGQEGSPKWQKLDLAQASLVDCVTDADGELAALVADPAGNVWSAFDPFEEWSLAMSTSGPLKALDSLKIEGEFPVIASLAIDGSVTTTKDPSCFPEGFTP